MNRRKKAKQIFNKKLKKAKAKLQPENQKNAKPKYVSKADRAKEAAGDIESNQTAEHSTNKSSPVDHSNT
jgi:Protein of unknown function (DUF2986)